MVWTKRKNIWCGPIRENVNFNPKAISLYLIKSIIIPRILWFLTGLPVFHTNIHVYTMLYILYMYIPLVYIYQLSDVFCYLMSQASSCALDAVDFIYHPQRSPTRLRSNTLFIVMQIKRHCLVCNLARSKFLLYIFNKSEKHLSSALTLHACTVVHSTSANEAKWF